MEHGRNCVWMDDESHALLLLALDDAYAYRLGEADNADDPELDDLDRERLGRYMALVELVRERG